MADKNSGRTYKSNLSPYNSSFHKLNAFPLAFPFAFRGRSLGIAGGLSEPVGREALADVVETSKAVVN